MKNILRAMIEFLAYRNQVRAEILIIELCEYLDISSLQRMADYMKNLADNKERMSTQYGKRK